jgi:hypothetical protein
MPITNSILVLLLCIASFKLSAQSNTNPWPSSGSIGIGTTSPSSKLHIKGAGNTYSTSSLLIQNSSNVEVVKVQDNGVVYANAVGITNGNALFLDAGGDEWTSLVNDVNNTYGFGTNTLVISGGDYGNIAFTDAGGTAKMQIKDNNVFVHGKLGIGETNLTKIGAHSFAVNGSAIFTKAYVKLNTSWPDYVFDEKYILLPIKDLEHFIKTNKHLPEVPTAADIEKEGIDLGTNQTILLKKIEELTLYIINQDKKIETLKEQSMRISELEKQIAELKQLLIIRK